MGVTSLDKKLPVHEMLDFLRKHDYSGNQILELCGILRPWVIEALEQVGDYMAVAHALINARGFPASKSAAHIPPNGVHVYPGDPDMFPLMKIHNPFVEVFIYEHAMVAFRDIKTGKAYTTRLD